LRVLVILLKPGFESEFGLDSLCEREIALKIVEAEFTTHPIISIGRLNN